MIKNEVHPIRQDYLNGMSFAAIARKYMIDSRTAKRYALMNLPLDELEQRPFSSILDPYKELIDTWLDNGPIYASTIHDRLIEVGCSCGYTIVNDYVRKKLDENREDISSTTKEKEIYRPKNIAEKGHKEKIHQTRRHF